MATNVSWKEPTHNIKAKCIEFFDLLQIQLKRIRNLGIVFLLMSIILPSGFLVSLKFITGDPSPERALHIVTGNIVLSVINICLVSLGQNLTFMKRVKTLQYFATMPVSKLSVILAIIVSFFLVSIPGVIVILTLGSIIFKFKITFNILLIPALILIGLSFAGMGSIIGIRSNDPMKSGLFCQFIMFIILFVSPLFVMIEALPGPLQILSYLLPSTYGVNLLRMLLIGETQGVLFNFLILFLFSMLSFILLLRYFEWGELD